MKRWWWNVRYAYWIRRRIGCGLGFAWGAAKADESFDEGDWTPRDAVDSELSYWCD